MVLAGETISTGGSDTCDCGIKLKFQICQSGAGYYIGTYCSECGPWSRESGYFKTRELAQTALDNNTWEPRG